MLIAHHLISTGYGWWLANDPRGSESLEIRVERLAALGPIHYGRKAVQPSSRELRKFHEQAHDLLQHQVREFDEGDVIVLGESIEKWLANNVYTCYACAMMPDHVHLLIRRHRDVAETMLEKFQEATRQALIDAERRAVTHPVWGGKGRKVFQNRWSRCGAPSGTSKTIP